MHAAVRALGLGSALIAIGGVAVAWQPATARACGGCFAPTGQVTVVTAHRMAVSLSTTETTLWDQIQYAGDPEDFAWILPVAGETRVELADNAFFEALEQATRVTLQGTFPPLQTFCPDSCGAFAGSARDAGFAAGDGGVTVYYEGVVGPYETVTIGSEDPNALIEWLTTNGYAIPDSIRPTIAYYVELGMNFAALRLSPNAGVNQMQPVRVSTPGLMPMFPLRMVSAGVDGKVGLELYILADGRWEAQNFPIVQIDPSELFYDWATGSFNYEQVFQSTIERAGGRAWVAEYAQPNGSFDSQLRFYSSWDESGAMHSSLPDYEVALRGNPTPYLTKLRTDLAAAFLDQDLMLQASLGSDIYNFINVSGQRNRPADVRCDSTPRECPGTSPRVTVRGIAGLAGGTVDSDGRDDGLCSAAPWRHGSPWSFAAIAMALGALALRRRRRW